jgi:hypothetical protein
MKIGLTNIVSCKIGSTQVNRVYIGSTLIWSYSAFDPDAQLFITNAAITEPVQQNAVNNLVLSLKSYGVWTKMKALYPFVGGTAAQHKFNLRNPVDSDSAFRLVFNGGWTHSVNGAKPNGTNAYANTFFKGGNWTSKDNAHMSYYSRTDFNGSVMIDMGVDDSPSNSNIRSRDGNTTYMAFNGGSFLQGASANSLGLFMSNRNVVGTLNGWKNSTKISEIASTSVNSNVVPYALSAYNNATSPIYYSIRECAFSSFGDGLTDTEAANYYTAVQTFQTKLLRQVGVPIVADSDAQAFLNAAVIENVTQANAVNTLVTDLKGYGIWTKMKAIYPFIGGTSTQHKYNLRNPLDTDAAFRLVFNGGWVHSSTGSTPNGVNAYANTFLIPSSILSLNSTHLSVYSRTNIVSNSVEIGSSGSGGGSPYLLMQTRISGDLIAAALNDNGAGIKASNVNSFGFHLGNRTGASVKNTFKNGVKILSDTHPSTSLNSNNIFISSYNTGNLIPDLYSSREKAFSSIGDGLTDTEAANYYTAVQTFQTTLSRNV